MDKDTDGRDFATGAEGRHLANGIQKNGVSNGKKAVQPTHQRLVLADPAAFRYLEEDPSTTVLERRHRLKGYEMYLVEQWACSRKHPTFVITTYTGLDHNSILVGVLGIPTNEDAWSPRLRVYLKAITKYHARRKETPLGTLMVTNLSGFPSALTVIPIPDGDLKAHREEFIVNENLKRMGCSGRAGLNLAPPVAATEAKFSQLYHTSDQIPLANAVVELVKLCQAALVLFNKLPPEYADGLLCDVTEQCISDWWADIGEVFNIDPNDGILGPTTVAALLGTLMGARNRLNAYGAPVAKDVFDISSTKRGIAYFQKSQKELERSRRLDRQTLKQLRNVTAKAASGEGWAMPRAVKSTVAELSGKGADLVNGREKARIAEVETLDIETFVRFGSGERFKWLWYGKPRKHHDSDVLRNLGGENGMIFNDNKKGGYNWSSKSPESPTDEISKRQTLVDRIYSTPHGSQTSMDHLDKDPALRKAVFKNISEKVTDTRSGLGRIRDAVGKRGLRGHHHKYSKNESIVPDEDGGKERTPRESLDHARLPDVPSDGSLLGKSVNGSDSPSLGDSKESSRRGSQVPDEGQRFNLLSRELSFFRQGNKSASSVETAAAVREDSAPKTDYMNLLDDASGIQSRTRGRAGSNLTNDPITANDAEAIRKMETFHWESSDPRLLRTSRSFSHLLKKTANGYWGDRWPRRMSFTAMVDVLAAGVPDGISESDSALTRSDPDTALVFEKASELQARIMEERLQSLQSLETPWVEARVSQIEAYDKQLGKAQQMIDVVYHQKLEEVHALHDASDDILAEERSSLVDSAKDVETLGAKLEYELSALESKVDDVEDGVAEFERQVLLLEARAAELDEEMEAPSWPWWCLRRLAAGMGLS